MNFDRIHSFIPTLCLVFLVCSCFSLKGNEVALIPEAQIEELSSALGLVGQSSSSAARQRLAVKRIIRNGEKLLEEHGEASNRFEVLGVLFEAKRTLFGFDDSARNRESLLKTAEELIQAPDAYAGFRVEADLLLTQARLARVGADARSRLKALNEMVSRYRNTPGDAKMLQTAMVMALELGDSRLVRDLRQEMAERFPTDFGMINFQRDKLGGQVFGAPFFGVFQRSDGGTMHLPADGLGRTLFLYFWTSAGEGRADLEALAAYWKAHREEISGRVHIISFNLDELPDAGESFLRELGVEWPALHFPEGRENPRYEIFAKRDKALISVTPTGYAAIVMSGATRSRKGESAGVRDFDRWFQSLLAREWTRPRYTNQLTSLFSGDFLVTDPTGSFDPVRPPEIKALKNDSAEALKRSEECVPVDTLKAIQDCFELPPARYRISIGEIRALYEKAETLCARAIADHPGAPDLWLVRNRRIVALMGLFKLSSDHSRYVDAVQEAEAVLVSGAPSGTEVLARYLLAREYLRQPGKDPKQIIDSYVAAMGGDSAPGTALALAAILALDVADRERHEFYRSRILERHLEDPSMWTFVSFLLDRHHRYWLYRVPFSAGWSYGRRASVFMSLGDPDEAERSVAAEFRTLEGKPFQLAGSGEGKWRIILFTGLWKEAKKASVYSTVGRYLNPHFEKSGREDVEVIVAITSDDTKAIKVLLEENPLECQVVSVPGGINHPVVKQFGVLDEDERCNALVLKPNGKVAVFLSGLAMSRAKGDVLPNVIEWHDRKTVVELLEKGELEAARDLIFKLAPPFDPEAVDERGRKLKEPKVALPHLRARARVYLAMREWDKALADAEAVAKAQMAVEGWMSLRTNQLDEDESFVELVKQARAESE